MLYYKGVPVLSNSHHLVRSNLWNRVGGCRSIGEGRLLVVVGNLVSNLVANMVRSPLDDCYVTPNLFNQLCLVY